jgi:hypothetical protein
MRNWRAAFKRLIPTVGAVSLVVCGAPRAAVDVALDGTPVAAPLVFHGNCVAGWLLSLELRLRETQGVDAILDGVTYMVDDLASGAALGGESLNGASLRARFGDGATTLPGRGSVKLTLAVRVDEPPAHGVRVSGAVAGHDTAGPWGAPFSLSAAQVIAQAPLPGPGGACS